jgi:hypothetical protein
MPATFPIRLMFAYVRISCEGSLALRPSMQTLRLARLGRGRHDFHRPRREIRLNWQRECCSYRPVGDGLVNNVRLHDSASKRRNDVKEKELD